MFRAALGFNHCTKNVNDTWLPVSGYALTRQNLTTGKALIVDNDNYLTCPSGKSNTDATVAKLDLSAYLGQNAPKVILGMRIKCKELAASGALISFSPDGVPANYGVSLTWNDVGTALGAAGAENYFEFSFDTSANTVAVIVNKTQGGTGNTSAALMTAVRAGKLFAHITLAGATADNALAIKDLYIVDSIVGDGKVAALGPIVIYPTLVDAVTQTNWTPSTAGADPVTVLNTNSVAGTVGDVMSTKTVGATLEASLANTGIPSDATIHGLSVTVTAGVDPSTSTAKFNLKNGSTSTTEVNFAPGDTTMRFGVAVGGYGKAPDGTDWTLASLNATAVVAKLG